MARLKVFDTNAMIAVSNGTHVVDPNTVRVAISIITKIELLAWPQLTATDRAKLRQMLAPIEVVQINQAIENLAIDLRIAQRLKLPDAIIAASALSLSASLVTNDKTFNRVPGLSIEPV